MDHLKEQYKQVQEENRKLNSVVEGYRSKVRIWLHIQHDKLDKIIEQQKSINKQLRKETSQTEQMVKKLKSDHQIEIESLV